MISIRRLLAPYREAGALSDQLNLWGFVTETVFLTKSGAIGCVLRLRGVDDECLEHTHRHQITQTFVSAMRLFDETFRLYQYTVRTPVAPVAPADTTHPVVSEALQRRHTYLSTPPKALYATTLWMVVMHEPPTRVTRLEPSDLWATLPARLKTLSWRRTAARLHRDLDRTVETLQQQVRAFTLLLADTVRPTVVASPEGVRFLRSLVNDTDASDDAQRPLDAFLDYAVADACVECHRDHLAVGRQYVRVLTLKMPPAQTVAHTLRVLDSLPGPWRCVTEWQPLTNARVRREVRTRQRHWHHARTSLLNYLQHDQPHPSEMLVDDSAQATVQELGACLTAVEIEGRTFGQFSLTLVLADRDPVALDGRVAACVKAFAGLDAVLFEETYNRFHAWLATVPGNHAHNVRRIVLMDQHAADLSGSSRPISATLSVPISSENIWRSSRARRPRRTTPTCTSTTSGIRWSSEAPAPASRFC